VSRISAIFRKLKLSTPRYFGYKQKKYSFIFRWCKMIKDIDEELLWVSRNLNWFNRMKCDGNQEGFVVLYFIQKMKRNKKRRWGLDLHGWGFFWELGHWKTQEIRSTLHQIEMPIDCILLQTKNFTPFFLCLVSFNETRFLLSFSVIVFYLSSTFFCFVWMNTIDLCYVCCRIFTTSSLIDWSYTRTSVHGTIYQRRHVVF